MYTRYHDCNGRLMEVYAPDRGVDEELERLLDFANEGLLALTSESKPAPVQVVVESRIQARRSSRFRRMLASLRRVWR